MCSRDSHEALKLSTRWTALRYVGTQIVEADRDEPEERWDLRDCDKCGSTLCRRILVISMGDND